MLMISSAHVEQSHTAEFMVFIFKGIMTEINFREMVLFKNQTELLRNGFIIISQKSQKQSRACSWLNNKKVTEVKFKLYSQNSRSYYYFPKLHIYYSDLNTDHHYLSS